MRRPGFNRAMGLLAVALWLGCATKPAAPPDPAAVATAYADAGRYDDAAREIDIAVRTHPKDLELRHQAADIHEKAGNLERAIGHLEGVLHRDPDDATAWLALAEIEHGRENITDAYVAYRRASKLAPDSLPAVSGLALTADQLGFAEEAEAAYERWAALDRELGVDTLPADRK